MLNTISSNTNLDSKKDAKRLKEIIITDDKWDLIANLIEILLTFAETTEVLKGSNYITNSLCIPMLIEIIKTFTIDLSYYQNSNNNE